MLLNIKIGVLMSYIVCERCNGYYELQKGESPEDFDRCQCGGKLKYVKENIQEKPKFPVKGSTINSKENNTNNSKNNKPLNHYLSALNKLITNINKKINLTSIYIGLFISLIIPVIGFFLFGNSILLGQMPIINVAYYIILPMTLFGGFIASLISCNKYSDGLVNGGFLGLIFLFNLALIIGILAFILMAVVGSILGPILNTFSQFAGNASQTSTLNSNSYASIGNILSIIVLAILSIIFGSVGGWVGIWTKNKIKGV